MDRRRDRARRGIDGVPGVHRQGFDPHFALRFHRAFSTCHPSEVEGLLLRERQRGTSGAGAPSRI